MIEYKERVGRVMCPAHGIECRDEDECDDVVDAVRALRRVRFKVLAAEIDEAVRPKTVTLVVSDRVLETRMDNLIDLWWAFDATMDWDLRVRSESFSDVDMVAMAYAAIQSDVATDGT